MQPLLGNLTWTLRYLRIHKLIDFCALKHSSICTTQTIFVTTYFQQDPVSFIYFFQYGFVLSQSFVTPYDPASSTAGEGFHIPEAKSRVHWYDPNTLMIGTDFKDPAKPSLTDSGYPISVCIWRV